MCMVHEWNCKCKQCADDKANYGWIPNEDGMKYSDFGDPIIPPGYDREREGKEFRRQVELLKKGER